MYIYKKKQIRLITVIVILFLFGCVGVSAPTKLGIKESEWSSYAPDRQQALLDNYEKFTQERDKFTREKQYNSTDNVFLEVGIHGGKVMMPPFNDLQDYNPVSFVISKKQCRDIVLQHPSDKKIHVEMGVCFHGNILYLDPSHYDLTKKTGSISINSSPLWLSGFSYKGINSSGYVRLNNVTVEIMQKEEESASVK